MTETWCLDSRSRRSWPGNADAAGRQTLGSLVVEHAGATRLQLQASYT